MDEFSAFFQANRIYFELTQVASSVINILGWTLGAVLIYRAWRRNSIDSVSVGPINFRLKEEALKATAAAARDWQTKTARANVDVPRMRATIERAFEPETADKLIGRAILWADDNPSNNDLAVRALDKLQTRVVQVTSTEAAIEALREHTYDLVISDMGRGTEMRAGYDLLKAIRDSGNRVPFLIFSSADKPEFRAEAASLGAQLSTNDMLELIDSVILHLSQ